jgi:PhzF family phenazine biosynthesis protein
MQNVAREMKVSETAFLYPEAEGYHLRWFTPAVEVDLCGHATLASAHILWERGYLTPAQQARFHTRSGLLTAGKNGEWIEMNFPAEEAKDSTAPPELITALGIKPLFAGKNRFDYIIEVESEHVLRSLRPNLSMLGATTTRGVIVTSLSSSPDYDFVSRFFAPAVGIPEDPVTGSAHCCLGPYWKKRLKKDQFRAYQASARGGVLKVRVEVDRVFLSGQAVTILEAELLSSP